MAKAYKVTGPLATPYLETGERIYLYEGAFLPSNVREGEADRLVDLGLVTEVDVDEEDGTEDSAGGPPAKSASKADWEAYARSQGATDDDLDGATKDDLIASYGS
jgi:hypothetical protein